jgi:hypothetical protein
MTGPLYAYEVIGMNGAYIAALIIGIFFGFALERAGFGDARNLVNIFYFRDMRVLRVMFTAIVTAMVGLVILSWVGLFDYSILTQYYLLNTYLWPQLLGGIIFGLGFVIGGYCPGTSVVAIASGKYDALVFFIGLGLGIFIFAAGWPIWGWFYKSADLGKLTLWQVFGLSKGVMAAIILAMALAAFYLAGLGEKWAPYGKWSA